MPTYLYLLKSGDLCKIGITDNLDKRLRTYTTHNPSFELYKSYITDKAQALEVAVKATLKTQQVPGRSEWFTTPIDAVHRLVQYLLEESYQQAPVVTSNGDLLAESMLVSTIMRDHGPATGDVTIALSLLRKYLNNYLNHDYWLWPYEGQTRYVGGLRTGSQLCSSGIWYLSTQEEEVTCIIDGATLGPCTIHSPKYLISLGDSSDIPAEPDVRVSLPLPAKDLEEHLPYIELGMLSCTSQGGYLREGHCEPLTLIKEFKCPKTSIPVAKLYKATSSITYKDSNWVTAEPRDVALDNIQLAAILMLDYEFANNHLKATLGKYEAYSRPLRELLNILTDIKGDLDRELEAFFGWLEENVIAREPDPDPDFDDQESYIINLTVSQLLEIRRLRQHTKVVLDYNFKHDNPKKKAHHD